MQKDKGCWSLFSIFRILLDVLSKEAMARGMDIEIAL
jgi:hypothetical protein